MKWLRRFFYFSTMTLVVITVTIFVIQNFSDGPVGPIPGAQFSTGTVVEGPVNWSSIIGFNDQLEFQLVSSGSSRTAGAILLGDQLYIPCDLGFIWNRFPTSFARWMLHTIYVFKDWHEIAMRDGNVVIRKDGLLYERELVRVTDTEEVNALRNAVVGGLKRTELPVDELRAIPTQGPRDIWFFRVTD